MDYKKLCIGVILVASVVAEPAQGLAAHEIPAEIILQCKVATKEDVWIINDKKKSARPGSSNENVKLSTFTETEVSFWSDNPFYPFAYFEAYTAEEGKNFSSIHFVIDRLNATLTVTTYQSNGNIVRADRSVSGPCQAAHPKF